MNSPEIPGISPQRKRRTTLDRWVSMKTGYLSLCGIVPILLVGGLVTGCSSAARSKSGGSFVKVPSPRKQEPATKELKLAAARVLVRDEQYSDARRLYKEVLEKDAECVEAVLGIAQLDHLAMRPEEAESGYRKGLALAPDNPKVMSIVAEYYASLHNHSKAAELYERAIELDPDQKAYHYQLAVAMSKEGRINESLPHFTQAVGAGAAHYNVGRILFDQKRFDESEQHFLQALNKDPKLLEAQQWLREVRRSREGELARRGFRNVPQSNPTPTPNVAQTAGVAPTATSQQVMAAGNTTQILPGGNPQIVTREQPPAGRADNESNGAIGANSPSTVPGNPGPSGANGSVPTSNGLSPAQLEQMRNQQLRSQQPAEPWSTPRAY